MVPTIRLASADDLQTVVDLRMAFLREMKPEVREWGPILEATRRYVAEKLPTGEFMVWFAEERGEVVGTSGLVFFHRPPTSESSLSGAHAYVLNMYTLPEWRGRGIATGLLEHMIEYIKTTPACRISLHASERGRPVYERLGFVACEGEMVMDL